MAPWKPSTVPISRKASSGLRSSFNRATYIQEAVHQMPAGSPSPPPPFHPSEEGADWWGRNNSLQSSAFCTRTSSEPELCGYHHQLQYLQHCASTVLSRKHTGATRRVFTYMPCVHLYAQYLRIVLFPRSAQTCVSRKTCSYLESHRNSI